MEVAKGIGGRLEERQAGLSEHEAVDGGKPSGSGVSTKILALLGWSAGCSVRSAGTVEVDERTPANRLWNRRVMGVEEGLSARTPLPLRPPVQVGQQSRRLTTVGGEVVWRVAGP